MIITLEGLNDTRLEAYTQLTDERFRNKFEPENGIFIAESQKVIERALAGKMVPLSYLVEEKWLASMHSCIEQALIFDQDFPVFVAPAEELAKLTGYEVVHGALGAFRRPQLTSAKNLVQDAHRIAVLENITHYASIGAIFRSAAALGIDAILVTPSCHDPLYHRAVRVSMGTIFQIPWTNIGSISNENNNEAEPCAEQEIKMLQHFGFKTVGFSLHDGSINLDSLQLSEHSKLALIFGTKGDRIAPPTMLQCDYTVKIPMTHQIDSFNVAAAATVSFWQLRWRG